MARGFARIRIGGIMREDFPFLVLSLCLLGLGLPGQIGGLAVSEIDFNPPKDGKNLNPPKIVLGLQWALYTPPYPALNSPIELRIACLDEGRRAQLAGLMIGDIVYAINGFSINELIGVNSDWSELTKYINIYGCHVLKFAIIRNDEQLELEV